MSREFIYSLDLDFLDLDNVNNQTKIILEKVVNKSQHSGHVTDIKIYLYIYMVCKSLAKLNKLSTLRGGLENKDRILRSIEIPPEYYHAGLSILNYFITILEQKYPDESCKVCIDQDGHKVRMTIESPEGTKEYIEKTLQEYGLVVAGRIPPEQFLSNKLHVMELKQKLEIAHLEIKHKTEILALAQRDYDQISSNLNRANNRVEELEKKMLYLLGEAFDYTIHIGKELENIIHATLATNNKVVIDSLEYLKRKIDTGVQDSDEVQFKEALSKIKQSDPGVFQQVYDLLVKGAISGAAGNQLYSWLITLSSVLPH